MRTAISGLDVVRARSLDEALRLRREHALVPLAGCTDLYVALEFGTLKATRFLDLWGVDELRGIRRENGRLVIGALTTHTELRRSRRVREWLPILAAAAREVGGVQIQNRGTLGGNIANASPAGDTLPVLAVAEADVVLRSRDAERRVPFLQFYTGYRATVLRDDELIVAIEIPPVEGPQFFRKVGTRAAQAISKIVIAAVRDDRGPRTLAPTGARSARPPRIALGSVAPTVVRLHHVEAALAAGAPVHDAVALLPEDIRPIDDLRSTAAYRLRVAANLIVRFWGDTSA